MVPTNLVMDLVLHVHNYIIRIDYRRTHELTFDEIEKNSENHLNSRK